MKKLFAVLFILCCFSDISMASALGGYDAGSLNSQYMRDLRTHEAITRARTKNETFVSTKRAPKTEEQIATSPLKSIIFLNNKSINSDVLLNVVRNKINQPMTPENISAIRKELMRFYQSNGYYSALVMVNSQDTQRGELILEINEGGKNSIEIQN